MRFKILLKPVLFIGILLGLTISADFFYNLSLINNTSEKSDRIEDASLVLSEGQLSVGSPIRLKIPDINVDASIEYVGLAPDGTMGVPEKQADVAWFKLGPRPGEVGSAVIAGHYGQQSVAGSVFDNLHKLRQGDKVYIEDESGGTISFVVRESRRYDPQADASDVFRSDDGGAHLNLITCEGEWDEASQSYSKRLVVFTDRI